MSVFYAYSNNRDETKITYNVVCEELDDLIIDVSNNDSENSHQLLNKIKNHIKSADIFIADITPDYEINDNIPLPNPNVMMELGYALQYFEQSNIILLLNKKISNKIPSMLSGFEILHYDSNDKDYHLDIIEKIVRNVNNYESKEGWITFNYSLSQNFMNKIMPILDIKQSYPIIRLNKKLKQVVILFPCNGGFTRQINVITKQLKLKSKSICLSIYPDIYDELKHIEILANISWFS